MTKGCCFEDITKIQSDAGRLVIECLNQKIARDMEYMRPNEVTWVTVPCPYSTSIAANCMRQAKNGRGLHEQDLTLVDAILRPEAGHFCFGVRRKTNAEKLHAELKGHLLDKIRDSKTAYYKDIEREDFKECQDAENLLALRACLASYHIAVRLHNHVAQRHLSLGTPSYFTHLPVLSSSLVEWLQEGTDHAPRILLDDHLQWKNAGEAFRYNNFAETVITSEGRLFQYSRPALDTYGMDKSIEFVLHTVEIARFAPELHSDE